jgi:hypothetical protein
MDTPARPQQQSLISFAPCCSVMRGTQGLALPRLVYLVAQSEARHYSLSRVDMRMGEIYL